MWLRGGVTVQPTGSGEPPGADLPPMSAAWSPPLWRVGLYALAGV
ncbi:PH domain-containing protein, partial [Candidatus Frankia alpina]